MEGVVGRATAAGLAVLLLATQQVPATAADDGAFTLPGGTSAAITIDLDGRPGREVVRVITGSTDPGRVEVDIWGFGDRWRSLGTTPVMRSDEAGGLLEADAFSDVVALLPWTEGGTERLLLVTGAGEPVTPDGFGAGCCITLFELRLGLDGPELLQRSAALGTFEQLMPVDLDGDGTDELVATERPSSLGVHAAVIRWDGEAFDLFRRAQLPSTFENGFGMSLGESDGLPGEEALFGPTEQANYARLYLDAEGRPQIESTLIGRPRSFAWVATAVNGRLVVIGDEVRTAEWPRGGEYREGPSSPTGRPGGSVWPLVNGEAAVIINEATFFGPMPSGVDLEDATVMDLDFETVATVQPSAGMRAMQQIPPEVFSVISTLPINFFNYGGPLYGGLDDGRQAAFVYDNLVTLDRAGRVEVAPATGLEGFPIGTAGPGSAWLLTMEDGFFPTGIAYLYPVGPSNATATLLPMDDVLVPAETSGVPPPTLRGAVRATDEDGDERLLAPDGGFEAIVDGPPGSRVHLVVGQSLIEDTSIEGEPVALRVAPRRPRDENQEFDAVLVVVTPTGRVEVTTWAVEILREPPELGATAETKAFALAASVEGETSPNATVTIGGTQITTEDDGTFRAEVGAWPWPQDVRIVARDPVGNETVQVVSVVGIFDYRGLPWVPIVGVLTVASGAVLYARIPRRRASEIPPAFGDGRLEEIDAD